MEELLARLVAAILTNTVLEGVGTLTLDDYPFTVNADGTVTVKPSDKAKAKNWVTWETYRTFYWPVVQSVGDAKDWPTLPSGGTGAQGHYGTLSGILGQLAPLTAALGPQVPAIISAIEGLVTTIKPTTTPTNVPSLPTVGGK